MVIGNETEHSDWRTYYVSVQAGQILEDRQAAAYELEVRLNGREHTKLRELFDELSSMDEAQTFHFVHTPYGTASDGEMNAGYDGIIQSIYRKLYEHGTDDTKRHIESMGVL
ncbi:hypothetical protein KP806_09595 [Paenibacillus sp. N4]|uniref:hypothetical protein n=1 Tax=Paenibacillus vietnamensis TaxID=2590547 RepID=UPI001CD0DB9A|nr:hypothetical protein [Paenibacillus vietnamensis]MCA0755303.1 hypothetical protein [Paenibacillus vietnamensis]